MNIIKSLEWRYACKKFDENKKLSDVQIETIKKAFNLTPTSFGLQPVKMIIISGKKLKEKLHQHAFYQPQITTCSHLLVFCRDTDINEKTIDAYFDLEKKVRNTSEEVIGKFRNQLKDLYKNKSKEEIAQSTIQQAYIILGNLMTVCAIENIDTCPMEGFVPEKIDEELNLAEKKLKSILMLPIGIRAENDFMSSMKKVRKSIDETVIEFD